MTSQASAKPARKPIPKSKRPLPKGKQIGMRLKPQNKNAWDRLPFVGEDHGPLSDWDVPMTGGHNTGCHVGKMIAGMYLKYLRDERDNPLCMPGFRLDLMLVALMEKTPTTTEERESRRGQMAGFTSEIAKWLKAAAIELGSNLDRAPTDILLSDANSCLFRASSAPHDEISAKSTRDSEAAQ